MGERQAKGLKKVRVPSAMPIYIAGAVWLVVGLVAPGFLLKLPGLLGAAALSAAVGWIARRLFPGREIEVEEEIDTGDAALDRELTEGRRRLEALRQANIAIEDAEISAALDRMDAAGEQIFTTLRGEPKKYPLARRFLSYYLPTVEKLMDTYQRLMGMEAKGEKIQTSLDRIRGVMGQLATAFEKFADNLFADTELDVDAEIQVLKTMMTGDDLTDPTAQQAAASGGH